MLWHRLLALWICFAVPWNDYSFVTCGNLGQSLYPGLSRTESLDIALVNLRSVPSIFTASEVLGILLDYAADMLPKPLPLEKMFAALNVLESSRAEITNLYDPKNNPSLSEKTNKLAQRIIDVRNGIKNSRVNKKMKKELYYLCNEIYMWLQMVICSDPSSPLNHEFKKMNTAKIENYKSLYTKKNAVLLFEQCCNLHGVDKEKTKSSLGFIEYGHGGWGNTGFNLFIFQKQCEGALQQLIDEKILVTIGLKPETTSEHDTASKSQHTSEPKTAFEPQLTSKPETAEKSRKSSLMRRVLWFL